MEIKVGKTATVQTVVDNSNTAKTVGSGSLEVFGTPMMVALMEKAACECLADILKPGQTTVGTKVQISHMAATPLGMRVDATATVESVDGRRVAFKVSAKDSRGEIGSGTHVRAIVDEVRFMEKVQS